MKFKPFCRLLRDAAVEWWNDNTFRLAASLAFYTIFSLAPVMIIAVGVTGLFFGREQARENVVQEVQSLIGPEGGKAIAQMSTAVPEESDGKSAIALGIVTIIIGSTVVFAELQSALNQIWDVQLRPDLGLVRSVVRTRLLSFAVALAVGFLLLVSLVISAVISGTATRLSEHTPSVPWLWQLMNILTSMTVVTLLFAMIYKYLPDVRIDWNDVMIGAFVTALLFTAGKYVIGMYLGRLAVGSAYGAAGSFVVLLVWVYYSALICFFGAEFTQVYARRYGSGIRPESHAVRRGLKPDSA